ncbi:MAG TPA: PIN domain nuclease [Stellaceae bacterium]|jgi:predicted nucleic acid-binding protein|nr:PIN domain nuclease [Stellaceae bacterium]
MTVVDSSVWIDFFNQVDGRSVQRLRELMLGEPLLIGDLILCEILQGFRSDAAAELVERSLARYEAVALSNPELAVKAAANYRFLRSRGITIRRTIDIIIGTYCIERGHALLHSDQDFEPMERLLGLRTV